MAMRHICGARLLANAILTVHLSKICVRTVIAESWNPRMIVYVG